MPKKVRSVRSVPTAADVEDLFDRFEAAMLDGDPAKTEGIARRFFEIGEESTLAAEIVTRRLIEGRTRAPVIAYNLLESVAGEAYPDYLLDIVEDPAAPDITRFAAQRRYGWPERGENKARREFLDTLTDPDATLVTAVQIALATPLPDGEVLEEVIGYLTALASDRRRAAISRIAAEIGPPALRLLHALLHINDAPTQRLVLAQLVVWREPASIGAVRRLAATARTKTVRAEAENAVNRLRLRDVKTGPNGVDLARPLPPLSGAYFSQLDGDGGQIVIVIRELMEGLFCFVDVFHNDSYGIKEMVCEQTVTADLVQEMLNDLAYGSLEFIEVDLPAVRGALERAAEVNGARRKPIPPNYEVWEPLLHDADPPPFDEVVVFPELDDAPYAGRDDLLAAGDELLDHSWFHFWFFNYDVVLPTMIQTPIPSRGHLTDLQIRPLVETFMIPEERAVMRSRLRRQAWLLDRVGDTAARDQALAVASLLANGSMDDLVKNRFIRRMIRRSVENAAVMYYDDPLS